ncbi:DUF4913 domain-containing protein [Arthrobacter sp. B0490]|uniref:DUF4913 domain-containing protein n=1 Tax=Arthrobacter sp. B0490 TaxID=2058891 RepID=UPI000CE4C703|nr:DUF4913 domain-containing protein [Arthrobacter sp. B0490]
MQSPFEPEKFEPDDEFDRLVYRTDEDAASEDADTSEDGPKLYFPNLEVFVTDFLVNHYARPLDPMGHDKEFTWCSSWWAHTEAVSRLSALWRAWETLRLDGGTGMADWWRNYADPTMHTLFYSKGPFKGCTATKHAPASKPLPVVAAPKDLFCQP